MGGILSYLQEILGGGGGGDSVLVNKKEWGGFRPGGDFVLHSYNHVSSREHYKTEPQLSYHALSKLSNSFLFSGKNCEVNLSKKYQFDTCPTDLCRPPSICQPLIDGGFRCEGCPNQDHYNQFCQLTTRSFPKGSFLIFPSIKTRHRFTLQLK